MNRYAFRVEKKFSSKELSQLFSNTTMNFLHEMNFSTQCRKTQAKSLVFSYIYICVKKYEQTLNKKFDLCILNSWGKMCKSSDKSNEIFRKN